MFKVTKFVAPAILGAVLLFASAQDSMAYGRRHARWYSSQFNSNFSAPMSGGHSVGTQLPSANNAVTTAGTRTQYQSAFQAPAVQPQAYSSAPHVQPRGHHFPVNNNLPKSDPRRYSPN